MSRLDAIREIGVTEQTPYRWKKKRGLVRHWSERHWRMRDELLNGEIFYTLREAQIIIWKMEGALQRQTTP